jgi:hypothetical protein
VIDHGDPDVPPLKCEVDETVVVGPFSVFFSNQNAEMGLKGHSHHAFVTVTFDTVNGGHGYPSFLDTNDALRARIRGLTNGGPFRKATNEDVARRLFAWLDGWVAKEWEQWGGQYQLRSVRLEVVATPDRIGHDDGTTTYTVTRSDWGTFARTLTEGD